MGQPGPPRDYLLEMPTRTVCPACFATGPRRSDEPDCFIDGWLVSHHGRVWMRRFCPVHGESESLYEEDLELWRERRDWRTPPLPITPDRAGAIGGSPATYRHGLPASHGQHTCILVLNLTDRCNLTCPACYAESGPGAAGAEPSLAELLATVRTMLSREQGKLGVVMLSGGEPTLRADLPDLVDALAQLDITRIMINTNGCRLATDDRLLDRLRRHRSRVEIYLQLDGLASTMALRGEELLAEKLAALRRLDDAGIFCTLVAALARGVNEDQLGSLVRLGMGTPHCAGLALQPIFGSGRSIAIDPRDRLTPTGIQRRLAAQTGDLMRPEDFIPLPCSHPDCCDVGYFVRCADGQWRSLPALLGRAELHRSLPLVGNTITFEQAKGPAIKVARQAGRRLPVLAGLTDCGPDCSCLGGLLERLGELWPAGPTERALERLAERTFRITIKQFMDAHTFHEARLRQCCVHSGTFEADPRRYSFCWRWLFADATDTGPAP